MAPSPELRRTPEARELIGGCQNAAEDEHHAEEQVRKVGAFFGGRQGSDEPETGLGIPVQVGFGTHR
jgi:hypothetical protein